jgi:hypothetical protein
MGFVVENREILPEFLTLKKFPSKFNVFDHFWPY